MAGVKPEIGAFIERVIKPAKEELKVIKDNDWTLDTTIKRRTSRYALQSLLTDRALGNMKALYKMADEAGDLKKTRVKNAFKILREFYTILNERYQRYVDDISWMELDLDDPKTESRQEAEVKLRSLLLDNINKYENILRDINDGDEDTTVIIELNKNTKSIPLMMQDLAERTYPEIKEHLKKEENHNKK